MQNKVQTAHASMVLLQAPPPETRPLFLQYAEVEEKFGLARSAMAVYDEAVRTVPVTDRLPVYQLYISRASQFFGVGKVHHDS